MSDTKFPKAWNKSYSRLHRADGTIEEQYFPTIDVEAMNDWFKRCIEDIPQIEEIKSDTYPNGLVKWYPTHNQWLEWKEKWFGQFKEDSQ